MDFQTASARFSSSDSRDNAKAAVAKIKADLAGFPVAALLFFASPSSYDSATLAAEMHAAFPGAKTFGCSASGELHNGMPEEGTVTAMAFSPNVFETLELVGCERIDADPGVVQKSFAELGRRLGRDVRHLDYRQYFGFILVDGLSMAMERIMDRIGEGTDITFLGGCAGDEMKFEKTMVYAEGCAYDNGAVIAIMKPRGKWGFIKTQSIVPTHTVLTATKVEEEKNVVWEFDGKPAVEAYAEAIGVPVADISAQNFATYPLALMADGEPFIRSAATLVDGGGIRMYLRPIPGMRYTVAKVKDLVADTAKAVENKCRELGGISALVNVTCVLRELQIKQDDVAAAHRDIFSGFPSTGFFSFGEIYIGVVNQTATMVVFG